MIYRALRWLIVAALTALIAWVLFRSEEVAAAALRRPDVGAQDQSAVMAAMPCAPCSQAVGKTSGDKPPIP